MTADGDITSYDIHFKPCGREGNYCKKIVFPPATSILLTRESGLKPLTKYTFEVRAWSTFREGKWSEVSEYIGMCLFMYIHITVAAMAYIYSHRKDSLVPRPMPFRLQATKCWAGAWEQG